MANIGPIGTAGLIGALASKPDFLFRNLGKKVDLAAMNDEVALRGTQIHGERRAFARPRALGAKCGLGRAQRNGSSFLWLVARRSKPLKLAKDPLIEARVFVTGSQVDVPERRKALPDHCGEFARATELA